MDALAALAEDGGWVFVRHVFPAWSLEIPATFAETFVEEDNYWHAWDETRSVSLTSYVLTDNGRPVKADEIVAVMATNLPGTLVDVLPPGLLGVATSDEAPRTSRASRVLTGILAVDGRALLVTITSEDLDWARQVWVSIRNHPVGPVH